MVDLSFKEKLCHYIAAKLPEHVLREIQERTILKFGAIDHFIKTEFSEIAPERLRRQMWRYGTDNVLASLKDTCNVSQEETTPKGEKFVVIREAGLTISHIELRKGDVARPAKHREALAKHNECLEPDLFRSAESINTIHVAIVLVVPESKDQQQNSPKNILISVPYSDFSAFHVQIGIDDFFQYYSDIKDSNSIVIDEAWPSIRSDLLEEEGKRNIANDG